MFTENELTLIRQLQSVTSADLSDLARDCNLARSSTYSALRNLLNIGVIENENPKGTARYRISHRDGLERAAQQLVADFRSVVFARGNPNVKPKLVFTDNYMLPEGQLQALRTLYEVVHYPNHGDYINEDLFAERSQGASVIVRYDQQKVDRIYLSQMPDLRAVVFPNCYPVNVDFEACKEFGVQLFMPDPVTHKYFADAQVEYVLNAIFTLVKPLSALSYQLEKVENFFDWRNLINDDVYGKKVGVIFERANIRKMLQILQLLGCELAAACTAKTPALLVSEIGLNEYTSVDEIWQWADVVVILDGVQFDLAPLLELKSEEMPDFLINCSEYVDYDASALRASIDAGKLKGAAIDMLPHKWRAHENQEVFEQSVAPLLGVKNLTVTSEAFVFTNSAIARSYDRVFEILMNLAL